MPVGYFRPKTRLRPTIRPIPANRLTPSLVLLLFAAAPASAQVDAAYGHWEGRLRFREADMAIRLHLEPAGDSLRATLDVPGLVLAWEPVSASPAGDRIAVELPFGLGVLAVDPTGDGLRGRKPLEGDTLSLELARAGPPPLVIDEVTFRSDGTTLAGALALPEGEGPHPALVLLHGSGRQGRHTWAYRSWADFLARQGFAVLYYDKRGVGDSEGEYGAGLRQLADDGVAAVQFLGSRPDIDPRRIGLMGSSQGAWLAEQVAAELGDLAFLVLVSAAAGTPRDQEMQKIEYGMRADGRSESEIEDALAYAGLYFHVVRTGRGWPRLAEEVARARAEEWGQYVDQPETEADLLWWRENHDFQPAAVVGDLDLPVLLLYGGADWITPPIENAAKLRGLFADPDGVEVHVFPGADHRLEVPSGPDATGAWRWPGMADGLLDTIARWLERHRSG